MIAAPRGIRLTAIGDCTEFVLDGTHGSPPRTDTGIPVLSATNVKHGRLSYETERFTTSEEYDAYRRRLDVRVGDVLLTIVGTIGRTAVIDEIRPHVFQRSVAVLRPRAEVLNSRYLFHALNTREVSRQLATRTNQSAQAGVYLGSLKELLIPTPPLPEQRRMADILDEADAIRRKRKEAIVLTEELIRSIFLEMFGDPVTNPKRLERGELRDLLLTPLRNGLSPATGGEHKAQVLTLSAITRGAFDGAAKKDGAFAVDPWPDVRLNDQDFLVCRGNGNRDLVGAGAFPDRSDPSVVFPDTMIAARVNPHRLGRAYLEQLWKSQLVRGHVARSARTTNGTFKVNQSAVEATPILIPEERELARFESLALQQRMLAERQAAAYEASGALFESLVARAFQGTLASVPQ
jgi:type I restriction enzyme, S subunit